MKRTITKILALVLMLCMLIPQTVMAATTYYIEVSITGPNAMGQQKTVTGESTRYGRLSDGLAEEVVGVIIGLRNSKLAPTFAGTGLSTIVDDGITAFATEDDGTEWANYVARYTGSVSNVAGKADFKDVLSDMDSTFADLQENQANKVSYTTYGGETYVVTVTLKTYVTGSGGSSSSKPAEGEHNITTSSPSTTPTTPSTPTTPVDPADPTEPSQPVTPAVPVPSGTVSTSTKKADEGDKVTVDVKPDEGFLINQIYAVDEEGNRIPLTANTNNQYTFEMPAGDVHIEVSYIQEPTDPEETNVHELLNTDGDVAYVQGKSEEKFHPADHITRGQVAMIFYRLLQEHMADAEYDQDFEDVPVGSWCEEAVHTLAALGIVKGMTEEVFAPNAEITRAQFVAICARFAEAYTAGHEFSDVPEDYWAHDYINTATGYGWVNGMSYDVFAPNDPITRAQAVTIINRMLGRVADRAAIDAGEQMYTDVPNTYWAWYDINEASTGEILRGE